MLRRVILRTVAVAVAALALGACRREAEPGVYGVVPAFSLTNQAGEPFGSAQLTGSVWVGSFIFTRCPTVCPKMMVSMKALQDAARSEEVPVTLVSFSVDPDHDSPEVLTRYAQRYGADLGSWVFLTGDADVIKETAEKGFKLAVEGRADASAVDYGILHGTELVLVDRALQIRGYFPTSGPGSHARLLAAARALER